MPIPRNHPVLKRPPMRVKAQINALKNSLETLTADEIADFQYELGVIDLQVLIDALSRIERSFDATLRSRRRLLPTQTQRI